MCGLVGVVSSGALSEHLLKTFDDMLYFDAVRGWHSTGVAKIGVGKTVYTHKRAVPAMAYMDEAYKGFIKEKERPQLLIGHNRAATQGTVTDKNAHPFTHGDITLVHNGTLFAHRNICKGSYMFDVDSEAICHAISTIGAKETLEKLNGAFALVWYDASDCTLNFARNNDRTLWIASNSNDDILAWASEQHMLLCALERRNTTRASYTVESLPTLEHVKYSLKVTNKEKSLITKFKEYTYSYFGYNYEGGSNLDYGLDDYYSAKKACNKPMSTKKPFTPASEKETLEFVITKITRQYNSPSRGVLEGHTRETNKAVKAFNVNIDLFEEDDWCKGMLDYKQNSHNYATRKQEEVLVLKSISKIAKKDTVPGYVKGPNDTYITQTRYLTLVAGGCSMCGKVLSTIEAPTVTWMDIDVPLCKNCTEALDSKE